MMNLMLEASKLIFLRSNKMAPILFEILMFIRYQLVKPFGIIILLFIKRWSLHCKMLVSEAQTAVQMLEGYSLLMDHHGRSCLDLSPINLCIN
jgi:hypothetical protein